MEKDGIDKLLKFLQMLREKEIRYRIERQMPEALMVTFVVGRHCIEVDFFVDDVWFSVFTRDGINSGDDNALDDLILTSGG